MTEAPMIGPRRFKEIVRAMHDLVMQGKEKEAYAYFDAQNLNDVESLAVFRFLGTMLPA